MRRFGQYVLYSVVAIAAALALVALWQRAAIRSILDAWDVALEGAEWVTAGDDAESLMRYLQARADTVSLVSWEVGREEAAVRHRADAPRPLASTAKLLVLAAYAQAVVDGAIDPEAEVDRERWEALHLPRTDGGAHQRALAALGDQKLTWSAIAHAMIRHSDNAAPDLLMLKLGRPAIEAAHRAYLTEQDEVPFPFNGGLLLALPDPEDAGAPAQKIAEAAAAGFQARAKKAWALAERLARDEAFRHRHVERLREDGLGLSIRDQLAFADQLVPRGTAESYAGLMAKAQGDSAWAKVMQQALEKQTPVFFRTGTKGGSLPGVLTSAWYAQPKEGGPVRVIALLLEDVPMPLWAKLMKRFTQQELEIKALQDPAFAEALVHRLSSPAPAPDGER